MRTLTLALLCACGSPASQGRPDFASAPTLNTKVTSIQFLPDAEVDLRLSELAELAASDPEQRVRSQVVLRLTQRRDERGLAVLNNVYVNDKTPAVALLAFRGLRELCTALHGNPRMESPPDPPPRAACVPVYDGSSALPDLRPAPRLTAAEFYAAHGIATKVTRNGETVPTTPAEARKVSLLYPDPSKRQAPPKPFRSREEPGE